MLSWIVLRSEGASARRNSPDTPPKDLERTGVYINAVEADRRASARLQELWDEGVLALCRQDRDADEQG